RPGGRGLLRRGRTAVDGCDPPGDQRDRAADPALRPQPRGRRSDTAAGHGGRAGGRHGVPREARAAVHGPLNRTHHSPPDTLSRKEPMKAVQVTALDGPDSLSVAEVDVPVPGPDEVLIDVAYAGVTFPELLQSRGLYQVKHELPFTLGSEAAGVVSAVGDGVTDLAVGDRVATIAGKGGYAEVMTAPANATVKLPDSVSLSAAAGMPMN